MVQIPRGTRDFNAEEMISRRELLQSIQNTFESFGYNEIQTPTFESLELFTEKSGEGIISELYNFEDKGERKMALRPELTAPVMRFYIDQLQMEPKPLKLWYFGNCFRYDRPQKGRYREFWQAGCELIGAESPLALAELITMAYSTFVNAGLKKMELNIGNLKIMKALFSWLELSKDQQQYILPLIDKECFDDVMQYLEEQNICHEKRDIVLETLQVGNLDHLKEILEQDSEVISEITKMQEMLSILNQHYKIDKYEVRMSIVRGLDYYTGMVFEIHAPVLGAEKQICGGGVYDLIGLFGGRPAPTSGFALGFDRTLLALETEGFEFSKPSLDVFVIPVNEEMSSHAIHITQLLREKGLRVDLDLNGRGIGKAMKYANARAAKKAVIIGPRELEENMVTLRDLQSGDQKNVKIDSLPEIIPKPDILVE